MFLEDALVLKFNDMDIIYHVYIPFLRVYSWRSQLHIMIRKKLNIYIQLCVLFIRRRV